MSLYCLSKCLEDAMVRSAPRFSPIDPLWRPSFQPHYCPDAVFTT